MPPPRRAVILLSGGLDSATLLAIARRDGYESFALTFRYGQRHGHETDAAGRLAEQFGVSEHWVSEIDTRLLRGSALTGQTDVPQDRTLEQIESGIPTTYVPARNTVFLAFALAWAETLGAADIFIGVNAVDYSGYPDCRPRFIDAFQSLIAVATKAGVEGSGAPTIRAPLLDLTKAQIIELGVGLGVDYSLTHSCYAPNEAGAACGRCDACLLRRKGFDQAGIADPTTYA